MGLKKISIVVYPSPSCTNNTIVVSFDQETGPWSLPPSLSSHTSSPIQSSSLSLSEENDQ